MSAAQDFDADVIVVGAGPVGLTISNTLGQYGVKVLLLEKGEELIDYPRAVGMDDECLRSIQGIGLAGTVQQHLTPYHWMRFVTASGAASRPSSRAPTTSAGRAATPSTSRPSTGS
jgi:3-(3-hydroxy-phenyl)propionate hydroxylase